MPLPSKAIDRLWDRLVATYGRSFIDMYPGLKADAVKASWAHELAPYGQRLDAIAWALDNLPERPPNVIQFRALCRQAPRPQLQALPPPKPNPERLRAEMERINVILKAKVVGGRDWVENLRARVERGYQPTPEQAAMLRQASGEGPR